MAKDSEDREDLLQDATAYVRRVEYEIADQEPIFVGFRETGEPSFYFGQSHVVQFNGDGEIRRAFWNDRMLASYKHVLHWLDRSEGRVRLSRTALTPMEQESFAQATQAAMQDFRYRLTSQELTPHGIQPSDLDVEALQSEILNWLQEHGSPLRWALHPGLGRRKHGA